MNAGRPLEGPRHEVLGDAPADLRRRACPAGQSRKAAGVARPGSISLAAISPPSGRASSSSAAGSSGSPAASFCTPMPCTAPVNTGRPRRPARRSPAGPSRRARRPGRYDGVDELQADGLADGVDEHAARRGLDPVARQRRRWSSTWNQRPVFGSCTVGQAGDVLLQQVEQARVAGVRRRQQLEDVHHAPSRTSPCRGPR